MPTTTTTTKKPTRSQLQALEDIEKHSNPYFRVHGQSQHGGWHSVMRVLERNAWTRYHMKAGKWVLTDAGRAALFGKAP